MTIEIKLNGNDYGISGDGNCFTALRYGINENKQSPKYGEKTAKDLGYFNKLSNAALRLCREEIASSDDVVTLKEFALRVEAINKQLLEQIDLLPV